MKGTAAGKTIARAGVIAAIYVVLCWVLRPVSFLVLQFRVAEALTVLPILYPEAVPGLFAAGDPVGNFRADIAGAATYGWIAGESAAKLAREIPSLEKAEQSSTVETRSRLYGQFMSRGVGPDWREANIALQQIMKDYAGVLVRSDTILKAGLSYFRRLKEQVLDTMVAENSHTLMRCLEVLDLMECAEAIFMTALERKETRAQHKRSDFPFTNPLLADKFLTIRREKGTPVLEWRNRA